MNLSQDYPWMNGVTLLVAGMVLAYAWHPLWVSSVFWGFKAFTFLFVCWALCCGVRELWLYGKDPQLYRLRHSREDPEDCQRVI